jgi:hypothetical protein
VGDEPLIRLTEHQQALDEAFVAVVGLQKLAGQQPRLFGRERFGHADLDQHPLQRKWRAQFVRGVRRETSLALVSGRDAIHHVVQGPTESGDFVSAAGGGANMSAAVGVTAAI